MTYSKAKATNSYAACTLTRMHEHTVPETLTYKAASAACSVHRLAALYLTDQGLLWLLQRTSMREL